MLIAFRSFFPHCWFYIIIAFVQVDLSRLVRWMQWHEVKHNSCFFAVNIYFSPVHTDDAKNMTLEQTNLGCYTLVQHGTTWKMLLHATMAKEEICYFAYSSSLCKSFFFFPFSLDFAQVTMVEPYCMYNIVGVTSFGKFCGFASSYGVYTNVTSFVEFIERIVWP